MFNSQAISKNSLSISDAIHTFKCDFEVINKGFKLYFNNKSIFKNHTILQDLLQNLFFKNINYINLLTNFTYECNENYKSLECIKNCKTNELDYKTTFLDLLSLKLGNIYDIASKVEQKTKKIINHFNSIAIEYEKNNPNSESRDKSDNSETHSSTFNLESTKLDSNNYISNQKEEFSEFKIFFQSYKIFLKLIFNLSYDIKRKCRCKFQTFNEILYSILKSIKDKSLLILYLINRLDVYNQITLSFN